MIATEVPEFDARLLAGIRIALGKARELGYQVESMDVSASISQGLCKVHFAPLPEPGRISTGGDLSISVDPQTEVVSEIRRGQ